MDIKIPYLPFTRTSEYLRNEYSLEPPSEQLSPTEFEKMDVNVQQDIFTSTFGEFLVEPSLTIPLTVGIYSRWGAGKSEFLQKIMDFLRDFKDQSPIEPFTITMPTVILCITFAISCGLVIWPIATSWPAGIAAAICLTIFNLLLLSFARLALVSTNDALHKYGVMVTNYLNRTAWFLRLVYCVPPSIEDVRHILPVHVITVDLSHCVAVGDNPMTSLVNFTESLNNAVETDMGMIIPRLYRIFQAGPYRAHSGALQRLRSRWKISCCCIPSFLITILVILCLWVGVILFGKYRSNDSAIGTLIVCSCIVGASLIVNTVRVFVMVYCLVLPMKKRVKIVSTQSGMQEDTFLTVLKQEFDIFVDMLECMDGFARRQTRIVIKLDLIDSLEQQKILSLINAINLLVTEPGHPFILLLSVDPRLLIKAVDQTLATMPGPIINPREYLKNLIDLPFYVSEQIRLNYDGLIPIEIRSQLEEQRTLEYTHDELEWDGDGEMLVSIDNVQNGVVPTENGSLPSGKQPRSVTFPSMESLNSKNGDITENISHLLRNNENGTLTDVQRVMNVVSLSGRILRNSEVNFQWTRLAVWVCLCDGWPHKANWITLLCLDSSLDLPGKMAIKNLYLLLGYCMPAMNENDSISENSSTFFDTFVSTHKPSLTVHDVRLFSPYIFYMDPTIRKLMIDYLIAMKSGSVSKQPSLIMNNQMSSSRSNYPLSPGSSSKFMWRSTIDDIFLARMTVEDVANQLVEIEGIDELLLALYKTRIHENNINGRVLIQCDLNELRDVMQMKFGDWQLFKAWIISTREKDTVIHTRSVDKASSYRSSSRNMSYGECSQTESIPDSPKVTYTRTQNTGPLPALSETTTNNFPYTSHSPRSTPPQQNRKPHKHRRVISKNGKSISQDSESCSSPLKEQQVDPNWHRSADSGFASTDVDPNNRLLNSQIVRRVSNNSERISEPSDQIRPSVHLEASSQINSSDKLPSYKDLYTDTWNSKTELALGHIYKVPNDVLSSGSSEYVAIDIDDKKTWKFSKISDDEENSSDNNDVMIEMESLENNIVKERAPSLSEVPLPPISMLNDAHIWDVNPPTDFADTHDENDNLPPSPVAIHRKKAFQSKQLSRGKNTFVDTSTESEQLLPDGNDGSINGSINGSTKSEPNMKIIRGSRSSLKKSISNENGFKKRKSNKMETNESTQGLLM